MNQALVFVGVDVSKASVDVALRPSEERWRLARDEEGMRDLVARLQALSPTLIVAEASGGLELPLVAALAAEALPVVAVNPLRCATSLGRPGSWPRPTRWTPRCWRTSPMPCDRPCARCGTRRLRRSPTW
ncbi:MAG: IS110 family transposase, partial [Chloroflexi bacterium]|nr:IS110 family transposase [Chloroflexota bacterium]